AAVSLVRGGRLDFTRLHGIGSGPLPPVPRGSSLRGLGRMFGRSDEQQALDTWASSQVGMLIVTGIAGIGKSTVVASWLVRQRPRPYIYWFEIHEGTTNSAFLRDLAAFLARLGKRGLTNLLRERDEPEPRVLARLLVHELTDMPILLVLDNFHRAEADLTRLIRGPVFQLSQSTGTKVLVISRTVPVSTSRRKTPREARPEVLRLGGLDLESSLSLLRAKGFAGDEAAIRRAALLAPTISGGIVVHDSIREYIRDRLPEARRRTFHSLASAYFLDGSDMHDRLEGMYHLVESGDLKEIGSYLTSQGTGLQDLLPAS